MSICKHEHQSLSHSVDQILAQWFAKSIWHNLGICIESQDTYHSELKKNYGYNFSFLVRLFFQSDPILRFFKKRKFSLLSLKSRILQQNHTHCETDLPLFFMKITFWTIKIKDKTHPAYQFYQAPPVKIKIAITQKFPVEMFLWIF